MEVLRGRGWRISREALEHGLYAVSWPARFEVLADDPYFILDGGHNPQCAEELAVKDKDYAAIFSRLRSAADEVCCITPASTRALPAEDLATYLQSAGWPASAYPSVAEGVSAAVDRAKETGGMVCAAGSLYLAGPIRELFGCY